MCIRDRQLAVAELARPDLRWAGIQLLFLSACDAGAYGAEAESLATMFHRLGIQRLIASLWPVFDDATARLVAGFYGAIAAGDEPASALRQAQAAVIALSGKAANRCLRDWCSFKPVSYTHLDVYKRQRPTRVEAPWGASPILDC